MYPIPRFCHKIAPRTSPNVGKEGHSLAGGLTPRTIQGIVQAVECYPNRPYPHINHLESSISVEPHCVPSRMSPLFLSEPPGRITVCRRPRRRFSPLWTFEKNLDRRMPNFNGPKPLMPRNHCHFTHHPAKIKLFGKALIELAVTPCQRRKAPSMSLLQSGSIIFDEQFSLVDETTAVGLPVKRSPPVAALPHSTADLPITKQRPVSSLAKTSDKIKALPTNILESKTIGPEKEHLLLKSKAAKTIWHKPLSEKKPEFSIADSHALMAKAVDEPPAAVPKKPLSKVPEEPLPKDLEGKPPEVLGETLTAVPKKPPPKVAEDLLPKDLRGKTLELLGETLASVPRKPPPKVAKISLPKDLEGKTQEVLGETLAAVPRKPPPKVAKISLPKDLGQQSSLLPKSISIKSPLNDSDIAEHEDIATTSEEIALARKSFSTPSIKKEVDKRSSIVDFITSSSISVQGLESTGSTKEIEKPKLTASAELAEQQKSGGVKLQSLSAMRSSLGSKTLMKSPEIGKEIPEGSSRFFDKIVALITPGRIEKSVTPATVPTVESKYSGIALKPRSVATMKTLQPESGRKFDSYFSISKSASMNDLMPKAAPKAIPGEERQETGVILTPLSATVMAKKPASEEPEESRNVAASVAGGAATAVLIGSGFVGTIAGGAGGPKQAPLVESSPCNSPREPVKVTGGSEEPKHKPTPQKPPPKKGPLPPKAKLPMIVSIAPNTSNTPTTGPVVQGIPDLPVPPCKPLIENPPGKDKIMTESVGTMPTVNPKPASVTSPLGEKTAQDGQAQAIAKSESEDPLVCSEKLPHISKLVAMKPAKRVLKFTKSVERSKESSESLEMDSVRLAELKEAGKEVTPRYSPDSIPIDGIYQNVKAASPIAKPASLETGISRREAPLTQEDSSSHEGVTKPAATLKKQPVTIEKVLMETENVHAEKPLFVEVGPNSAGILKAEQGSGPATEQSEVLEAVILPVMRLPEAEPAVLACEPDNPPPESTEKVHENATIVALAALPVLGAIAVGSVTSAGNLGDVDKPSITAPVTFDETSERRSSLLRRKELLKRAREMLNEVEPAKAEAATEPAKADEVATSTQAAMGGAATSGNMKKGLETPDDWGISIEKVKHTGSGDIGILLSTGGSSGELNSPGRSSGRMKSQSPSHNVEILGSPRRLGGAATGVLKNLLKKDRTT